MKGTNVAKRGPKFVCECPSCKNKIIIQPTQLFSTNNWSSDVHFTIDLDQSWLPTIIASCAICGQDVRVIMNLNIEKVKKIPHLRLVVNR